MASSGVDCIGLLCMNRMTSMSLTPRHCQLAGSVWQGTRPMQGRLPGLATLDDSCVGLLVDLAALVLLAIT